MNKKTIFIGTAVLTLVTTGCNTLFGGKSVKTDAVLPSDREQIAEKVPEAAYTSEEMAKGAVKGDWAIETVNGKTAVGEKAPYLKFVPGEQRVYGSNGCNVINAAFTSNPQDSTIRFSNIASTMMMCGLDGITDIEINQALDATRYYSWEIKGDDFYLYFYNETHNQIMSLMHQNFEFLNGTWGIAAINGVKVDNPDMKLVIDVAEGKLHGNTGCNILNGTLETDMDAANSISFSSIATTRMACPEGSKETAFIVALEDACSAKAVNPKEAVFYNSLGKEVLRIVRTK